MIKEEYSNVKNLFLPYPKGFRDSNLQLNNLFKNLIGQIPDTIQQFIIVNNREAENEINELYPNKNIKTILIKDFHEIWLRDIMGISGYNKIYKPIYKPDYCNYLYTDNYLKTIDYQVREIIEKSINSQIIDIPLIIDGGNFVSNGEIGFITDKVLNDNSYSEDRIKNILDEYLGIKAVIIKSNKNDKLSHSDGYLNFLGKKRICLSKYPQIDFLKEDIQYLISLESTLEQNSLEIISIYDRPIAEKVIGGGKTLQDRSNDCLNSARGIYVNFLILNEAVIMPEYSIPDYKKTMDYNLVNKRILNDLGYNTLSINCDSLGKLGGSIHCCSFTN